MNPKRHSYQNKAYENFIRKKPCLVCGSPNIDLHHVLHAKKNSYMTIPLCRQHHIEYHHRGGEEAVNWLKVKYNVVVLWEVINFLSEFIDLNQKETK